MKALDAGSVGIGLTPAVTARSAVAAQQDTVFRCPQATLRSFLPVVDRQCGTPAATLTQTFGAFINEVSA
jgi:hypothetical protein